MVKFKVVRAHDGDRFYKVGEIREANEAEVSHLIGRCLEKMDEKPSNKSAEKLKNKAAK